MAVTNELAYRLVEIFTAVKNFMVYAAVLNKDIFSVFPGLNVIKVFFGKIS
jgi:hypothetical protein